MTTQPQPWSTEEDLSYQDNQYLITELVQGLRYEVQVTAVNESGNQGEWSESGYGVTQDGPPSQPDPPRLSVDGVNITVAWDQPLSDGGRAITHYDVAYNIVYTDRTGDSRFIEGIAATEEPSITVVAPETNQRYRFRVRAANGPDVLDNGPYSSNALIGVGSVDTSNLPATPTDLVASRLSDTSLQVTWQAGTGGGAATTYSARYRERGTTNWNPTDAGASISDGTAYTITGLSADTTYEVQVRAHNNFGNSAWAVTQGSTEDTGQIPAPAAPTFSSIADTSFRVSWGPLPTDVTVSSLRYRPVGRTFWTSNLIAFSSSTTFTIRSLVAGTQYEVQVRYSHPTDSSLNSAWSPSGTVTTTGGSGGSGGTPTPTAPATPTGLSASAASGNTRISVSWNASTGATSYTVSWARTPSGTSGSQSTSSTSLTTPTLPSGSYTIEVTATNAAGTSSAASTSVTLTPTSTTPGPVRNFRATRLSTSGGNRPDRRLTWDAPTSDGGSPITGYDIEWIEDLNESQTGSRSVSAATRSVDITTLDYSNYFWYIWAVNVNGRGRRVSVSD